MQAFFCPELGDPGLCRDVRNCEDDQRQYQQCNDKDNQEAFFGCQENV
jgi:hypothetical protein